MRIGLSGNNLTGPIPPEYGGLSSLSRLYLSGNDLTGSIPVELGNLTRLTALYLNGNRFTGPIPPEVGKLGQLMRLSLASNSFSGPIPPELGNLPGLTILRLDRNGFTGPIPLELTRLVNLADFDISETGACVPTEPAFEVWLSGIQTFRGRRCEREAPIFTDDPIVAGVTPVKAAHFSELRARIDDLRVAPPTRPVPMDRCEPHGGDHVGAGCASVGAAGGARTGLRRGGARLAALARSRYRLVR